jgi:formate-dependent nitrite reductase membrane component NrfD
MEPGLLQSADWPLLIDIYFFLGGLAGGAFLIATVADWLDGRRSHDVVRVGYYLAFLAILPGPLFLIVDLGLPSRFLHMLMVSKPSLDIGMGAVTLGPFHFKPYSPMNVGAWGLLAFTLCCFLTALDVFRVDRGARSVPVVRRIAGVVGVALGFFIAAYPGVLLGATARPLFISAHWLGALFLVVGASTGAAAIALVLGLMGTATREVTGRLMRFTAFALVIEAVLLVLFVASVAGSGSRGIAQSLFLLLAWPYGIIFWAGVVIVGLVAPLLLQRRAARGVPGGMVILASLLVLVGGFLVKYVIIAAGQAVSG